MEQRSKTIARNTVMLYIRMLLSTVVSLYTSRIVLDVLGVEDYGIYNIVGGVIILFSFLNTSLTNACQRFLSIEVAENDSGKIQRLFSTSLVIHLLVCIFVAILAETIGLWFVKTQLEIPEGRIYAALLVYHIALMNTCAAIIRVPYNAAIIANERMSFYAYTSIVESALKLLIVYLLMALPYDKLILYASLLFSITIFLYVWYRYYVERLHNCYRFILRIDNSYFRRLLSFSGWTVFGSVADLGYQQGLNIILNIFYGVALNAAMGVANVVRSTIFSFVSNLQVAANPQIIKSYSQGDCTYFSSLVYKISKYSFFLMLLFAMPFAVNVDFILGVWLVSPPLHTSSFLLLMMIFCLVDSLHGPLWIAVQATGIIKVYQIVTSCFLLANLPLAYFFLGKNFFPEIIVIIQIAVSVITLFVRLYYANRLAGISVFSYFVSVVLRIIWVVLLSLPFPIYIASQMENSWTKFFVTSAVSLICVFFTITIFGVSVNERREIVSLLMNKLNK